MKEEQQQVLVSLARGSGKERRWSTRSGAVRMARLRDRRERGFRCHMIEVSATDIEGLIAHGLLDRLQRDDPTAVERAIGGLLDRVSR